ncbi:MAG: YceD family protein [Desertimonas sp.]
MGDATNRGTPTPAGRRRLLINATELLREPGAHRHISVRLPLAELEVSDARLSGELDVDVELTSTLDDIEVSGTLTVPWSDQCARCLRPLAAALVVDVDERYCVPSSDPGRPSDPASFPIERGQIDLAPMAREEVLLGIPDAPVCRDDCPGLCAVCGADLSIGRCGCDGTVRDDRWAVLDQLRTDDGEPSAN